MSKFIALVCFLYFLQVHHGYSSEADTDYFWKYYYKEQIPKDAIPGGYDKNGNTTYVAMVIHPDGTRLVPATLYPGLYAISQSTIPNTSIHVVTHINNITVLCSAHHKRYKWVPITISNIHQINGTLVRGGHYPLGRALHQGEMKVGRVFAPENDYRGLWLPGTPKTGEFENFINFEILVYNAPCNLCWGD